MLSLVTLLTLGMTYPPIVAIDPGHPSEVGRGTHGRKLTEIHANWLMAKALEAKLVSEGIRVILTKRAENEFVTNLKRAEIANVAKVDLLIRLHCDGSPGSGFTVYYPALAGRDRTFSGPPETVRSRSKTAAQAFLSGFEKGRVTLKDNGLKTDRATSVGRKHGALIASIHSKVPVLLVEMATLTNRKDEAFIASATGRKAMADALADGVNAALDALELDSVTKSKAPRP